MRRNKNFPRKRHEILPLESDIKFIVSSCFGPNFGESCFHDISPLTNKNFLISDQNPRLKAIFSTIFFITVSIDLDSFRNGKGRADTVDSDIHALACGSRPNTPSRTIVSA